MRLLTILTYRLLEGGGHEGVEGNDEVIPGPEDGIISQHVVQFRDGVPAGQKDQDGPGTPLPADYLDQLQHQVHVELVMIHATQCINHTRRVLPLDLKGGDVLCNLLLFLLLLLKGLSLAPQVFDPCWSGPDGVGSRTVPLAGKKNQ